MNINTTELLLRLWAKIGDNTCSLPLHIFFCSRCSVSIKASLRKCCNLYMCVFVCIWVFAWQRSSQQLLNKILHSFSFSFKRSETNLLLTAHEGGHSALIIMSEPIINGMGSLNIWKGNINTENFVEGFRASYSPIQTSFSGKDVRLLAGRCSTSYWIHYKSLALGLKSPGAQLACFRSLTSWKHSVHCEMWTVDHHE